MRLHSISTLPHKTWDFCGYPPECHTQVSQKKSHESPAIDIPLLISPGYIPWKSGSVSGTRNLSIEIHRDIKIIISFQVSAACFHLEIPRISDYGYLSEDNHGISSCIPNPGYQAGYQMGDISLWTEGDIQL